MSETATLDETMIAPETLLLDDTTDADIHRTDALEHQPTEDSSVTIVQERFRAASQQMVSQLA